MVERHRALSLASRLLQPAHRRGAARRPRSIRSPAGASSGGATGLRPREERGCAEAGAARRAGLPGSIVIVGGGAAGNSAAETLRREGYGGGITLLSADAAAPYDRPNLSKDYLAGNAPEEWIPLRSPDFYRKHGIDLRLGARAAHRHGPTRASSSRTAAAWPSTPSCSQPAPSRCGSISRRRAPHVHLLRTLADSRAIITKAETAQRVVVIGASFIGLEAAAALRRAGSRSMSSARAMPLERVLGREIGGLFASMHEEHGVTSTSERRPHRSRRTRHAETGERLPADLVVAGIGVRPASSWPRRPASPSTAASSSTNFWRPAPPASSQRATSRAGPTRTPASRFASSTGSSRSARGRSPRATCSADGAVRRRAVLLEPALRRPILYVGHAETWDKIEIDGRVEARDCRVGYRLGGRALAVATIGRDTESLRAEVEFEEQSADGARRPVREREEPRVIK